MSKVAEVMQREVNVMGSSTPVIAVARQMLESGTNVVLVCDNERYCGIIAERDIVTGVVANARDPMTEPASSVISNHFPSVSPDDDVFEAIKLMANRGVHVLPVVKDGKLLGLLTLQNLAHKSQALAALVFSKTVKQACDNKKVTADRRYATVTSNIEQ